VKLLRTIRLDPSDTFLFERAAEPGEWAVPGTFVFAMRDASKLEGKARSAFRAGFLGIGSLGWSTLVQVVEASEADRTAAVNLLAQRLVEQFGAHDLAAAVPAAEEEIAFAASLADHPRGMLVGLLREYDKGEIREAYRTLAPGIMPKSIRALRLVEFDDEGEGHGAADEVEAGKGARG